MANDYLRLIQFGKPFRWEGLPNYIPLLISTLLQVRQRFDYILRILQFDQETLYFQIRDARNSILPGTADAFIHEVNYLTAGAFEWHVKDSGTNLETIGVTLRKSESE